MNFSKSFRFTSKTATALCWGTVSKQFAVSETDRKTALVVLQERPIYVQEIYVGANVLNFGKGAF